MSTVRERICDSGGFCVPGPRSSVPIVQEVPVDSPRGDPVRVRKFFCPDDVQEIDGDVVSDPLLPVPGSGLVLLFRWDGVEVVTV